MANFIDNLPTYQNYRDFGMECHGSIPSHWAALPNKYIFDLKKDLVGRRSSEYTLLSLTLNGVIKRDMENPEGKFPAEFDTYQEVSPGDFVFCLFDVEETPRAIGLSSLHGMITGAYTVFRPRSAFDKAFLEYFYLNLDSGKRLRFLYKGLRNTISKDVFLAFKTLNPPIHEQRLIARFLSVKTAQIDQAIQIKERQIERLKELKQILIQKAVTRGLDPHAPMRDSGIEWIGEIPAHWHVMANRALFRERVEAGHDDLPLLSVSIHSGVSEEEVSEEENIRGRVKIEDKTKYIRVCPGDIAFNMMRAWQGAIGAVRVEGMVSPAYTIAVPRPNLDARYFEYQYRTPGFIQQMDRYSKGITDFRKRLYWDGFKQLITLVPPVEEQRAIIEFIEQAMLKQNAAVALLEQQISKLKEYKATLINSAVTGKIKVPDVVEPTEIEEREIA